MMILTCSSVAIIAAGAAAAAVAIIDIVLLIGCYILLYIYLLGDRFFTDGLQSLPTYSAVSVLPQQCFITKRFHVYEQNFTTPTPNALIMLSPY